MNSDNTAERKNKKLSVSHMSSTEDVDSSGSADPSSKSASETRSDSSDDDSDSSNSSVNSLSSIERRSDYKKRLELTIMNRQKNARNWTLLVFLYYLVRAALVIFPNYENNTLLQRTMLIIQMILAVVLAVMVGLSYWDSYLNLITFVLYAQASMLALSNFNNYSRD